MKARYLRCALLISLASCANPFEPGGRGESPEDLLYQAYEERSDEKLRTFFDEWQQSVQPITEEEFDSLPEHHQALYSLYETFYDPRFPSKLGGSEWGDGIYENAQFFIAQNKLYFREVPDPGNMDRSFDTNEEYLEYLNSKDSLSNFRPRLSFPETEVLYLTEEYESILVDFLTVAGADGTSRWEDDHLHEERQKRLEFINRMATIIPGHWFGWHILTHPEASLIEIDPALTTGQVRFRIVYQGGYANYERDFGEWKLLEARLVWIE